MVSIASVHLLALSFPETNEHPHFQRKAFRVKKKIFATLSEKEMTVSLKLTRVDQSVFCAIDPVVIYPVAGGWGRRGFTLVNLKKVKKALFKDALITAYFTSVQPKLATVFLPK